MLRGVPCEDSVRSLVELGASLTLPTIAIQKCMVNGMQIAALDPFKPQYPCEPLVNACVQFQAGLGNLNNAEQSICRISKIGHGPLALAVLFDHVDIISYLLHKGAPVNQVSIVGRITPLHLACAHRNVAIMTLLLEAGADAAAVDVGGWNSLHYCVGTDGNSEDNELDQALAVLCKDASLIQAVDNRG